MEAAFHTHRFSRNAHLQALHAKTGPSTKWAARCLILFVQSTISTLTLEMDFEQCQQLLKAGSAAQLTSSRLRDRIIMVGLLNREPLDEISRTLDEQGFINLYAKV